MRTATKEPARYLELDVQFHEAIMEASGNRLGRAVIHALNHEAFRSGRYVGAPSASDCEQSNRGHQVIVDRLFDGDEVGATAAMNEHIYSSWLRRRPVKRSSRSRR
jgi:DNA-binding FadR family transcriptional regulator